MSESPVNINPKVDPKKESKLITQENIYRIFGHNWVFALFSLEKPHYIALAVLVSLIPLGIGFILSLFWRAGYLYLTNGTVYLHLLGFSLSLIAFGWFSRILPASLVTLWDAFALDEDAYMDLIAKWANRIANQNWIMIVVAIGLGYLNQQEVRSYWTSGTPPFLLEPWVNSHASTFFMVTYFFLHVLLTSFLLGSGLVGLIGFLFLFNDLFNQPLKLPYYRRTRVVVETTAWLVMWALIALASVLIFGRPLISFSSDIETVRVAGLIQSFLATGAVLLIGLLPIFFVGSCISNAKKRELFRLEKCYESTYSVLVRVLENNNNLDSKERLDQAKYYTEELAIIRDQTNQIERVPNIPIRFLSVTRISLGAIFSICAPFIQEWIFYQIIQ